MAVLTLPKAWAGVLVPPRQATRVSLYPSRIHPRALPNGKENTRSSPARSPLFLLPICRKVFGMLTWQPTACREAQQLSVQSGRDHGLAGPSFKHRTGLRVGLRENALRVIVQVLYLCLLGNPLPLIDSLMFCRDEDVCTEWMGWFGF